MKTQKLWTTALLALFVAMFVGSCKDDNVAKLGKCPLVVSTSPANLATGVPLNQVIRVTFNEAMDPTSITPNSLTLVDGGGVGARAAGTQTVGGTLTYDASTFSMIYTPIAKLKTGNIYTGTVATTVKDVTGNALQVDYKWTFTTVGATGPTVIATDPLNLATSVALNKSLVATFNVPMDPLTITATTFTLKQGVTAVTGTISYSGTTATFKPTAALLSNTTYSATITTGAKDTNGVALASNYVWTFTTVAGPTVISTDPINLAANVPLNKVISGTFSAIMDPLTITNLTYTVMQGVTSVAGSFSFLGSTVSFTPTNPLSPSLTYTATFTTGVKDMAGIPLASNYVWSFVTIAPAPTVTSTDPLDLATNVALNKVISATFSTLMDGTTITGTSFTLAIGVNPVAGAVNYSGSTATFTPSANLLSGNTYTATITTAAKNAGGTPLASNYVWTFSTAAPLGPAFVDLSCASNFTTLAGSAITKDRKSVV